MTMLQSVQRATHPCTQRRAIAFKFATPPVASRIIPLRAGIHHVMQRCAPLMALNVMEERKIYHPPSPSESPVSILLS